MGLWAEDPLDELKRLGFLPKDPPKKPSRDEDPSHVQPMKMPIDIRKQMIQEHGGPKCKYCGAPATTGRAIGFPSLLEVGFPSLAKKDFVLRCWERWCEQCAQDLAEFARRPEGARPASAPSDDVAAQERLSQQLAERERRQDEFMKQRVLERRDSAKKVSGKKDLSHVHLIMDRGSSYVSTTPDGLSSFAESVVASAPATIQRHIARIVAHEDDATVKRNLNCVLSAMEVVKSIISEKVVQCLYDGRGHSKNFMRKDGDPIIAVSCWNCSLQELRQRFESEVGRYDAMLERYADNTRSLNASCYVHLFYCFSTEKVGTTLCYLDLSSGKCITPNELM